MIRCNKKLCYINLIHTFVVYRKKMEEVADVTITDHYKPTGNSGEFKLRPVKQITDALIAKMKRELVQELLMVLLPVNIFFIHLPKFFRLIVSATSTPSLRMPPSGSRTWRGTSPPGSRWPGRMRNLRL